MTISMVYYQSKRNTEMKIVLSLLSLVCYFFSSSRHHLAYGEVVQSMKSVVRGGGNVRRKEGHKRDLQFLLNLDLPPDNFNDPLRKPKDKSEWESEAPSTAPSTAPTTSPSTTPTMDFDNSFNAPSIFGPVSFPTMLPTPVITTGDTVTPRPITPSPVTPSPITPSPETPSPITPSPETPSPTTPSPETPSPITPSPVTPSPITPQPGTPLPTPTSFIPTLQPQTPPQASPVSIPFFTPPVQDEVPSDTSEGQPTEVTTSSPSLTPSPSSMPSLSLSPTLSQAPIYIHPSCSAAQNGTVYVTPFYSNVTFTYEVLTTIDWDRIDLVRAVDYIFQGFLASTLVDCIEGAHSDIQGISPGGNDTIVEGASCEGITFFDSATRVCYVVEGSLTVYMSGYATLTNSKVQSMIFSALMRKINGNDQRKLVIERDLSLLDDTKGILSLYIRPIQDGNDGNTDSVSAGEDSSSNSDDGSKFGPVVLSAFAGASIFIVAIVGFIIIQRRRGVDSLTYNPDTPTGGETFGFETTVSPEEIAEQKTSSNPAPGSTWSANDIESIAASSTSTFDYDSAFPTDNNRHAHSWTDLATAQMALSTDRMDQGDYSHRGTLSHIAEKNEQPATNTPGDSNRSRIDRSIPKTPPRLSPGSNGRTETASGTSIKSRKSTISTTSRRTPKTPNVSPVSENTANPSEPYIPSNAGHRPTPTNGSTPNLPESYIPSKASSSSSSISQNPQTPSPTQTALGLAKTPRCRNTSTSSSESHTPGTSARVKNSSWTKKVNIDSNKESRLILSRKRSDPTRSPSDESSPDAKNSQNSNGYVRRFRIDACGLVEPVPYGSDELETSGDKENRSPSASYDFFDDVREGSNLAATKGGIFGKLSTLGIRPRTSYDSSPSPSQDSSPSKVMQSGASKTAPSRRYKFAGRRGLTERPSNVSMRGNQETRLREDRNDRSTRKKEIPLDHPIASNHHQRAGPAADIHERVWKKTYEDNDLLLLADTSSAIEPIRSRSPSSSISSAGRRRSLTPNSKRQWVASSDADSLVGTGRISSSSSTKRGLNRTLSNSSFAVIMDAFEKHKSERGTFSGQTASTSEDHKDPPGCKSSRNDQTIASTRRRDLILEARRQSRGRARAPVRKDGDKGSRKTYKDLYEERHRSKTPDKRKQRIAETTYGKSAEFDSSTSGSRWTPSPHAIEPTKTPTGSNNSLGSSNKGRSGANTAIAPASLRFTDVKQVSRGAYESNIVQL